MGRSATPCQGAGVRKQPHGDPGTCHPKSLPAETLGNAPDSDPRPAQRVRRAPVLGGPRCSGATPSVAETSFSASRSLCLQALHPGPSASSLLGSLPSFCQRFGEHLCSPKSSLKFLSWRKMCRPASVFLAVETAPRSEFGLDPSWKILLGDEGERAPMCSRSFLFPYNPL